MRKNNGGSWLIVFAAVIMVLVVITGLGVFGGIDSANIQNETIIEEDLAAIGIPADAECLIYDAASQGFDWDACGITEADMWRLHTNFTGDSNPITANLERNDDPSFTLLGSGISESSGIFTFPSTGYWEITVYGMISSFGGAVAKTVFISADATINDSTYGPICVGYGAFFAIDAQISVSCSSIFDVTNTSTHKASFSMRGVGGSNTVFGSSTINRTYIIFVRLGDT